MHTVKGKVAGALITWLLNWALPGDANAILRVETVLQEVKKLRERQQLAGEPFKGW